MGGKRQLLLAAKSNPRLTKGMIAHPSYFVNTFYGSVHSNERRISGEAGSF
jgi:hypothetical protein